MDSLNITSLPALSTTAQNNMVAVDLMMDAPSRHVLKPAAWGKLKRVPEASFVLCYHNASLYLKFFVSEPYFKADYKDFLDPVSEDSCVELFIAFGTESRYYNLEFNALGTCLAAYGDNRLNRQALDAELVKPIRHLLTWQKYLPAEFLHQWTLTLEIPLTVFSYSKLDDLTGTTARVNVYKCGDQLPEPHYLVWNEIGTPEPDYHQPGFFRPVVFSES